ncbi:winged helix-turn-helix transcriptional regulator [Miltoncostaea marina]|uniref:winged helix-turn-helix transcriptional regulator n=1 Tax=Miltoncostaea marina TaxID=2843215 RepID=UPI001C3D8118|nr:winged helix-turn-helix transcriptional regulator [Miltoncostaea marina]
MSGARTYADACAAAHALDLVGERWALLVVRELVLGPKRFTDLRRGLPGAGPNVLAQRLRDLERAGVVTRRTLPPPAASKVYELTGWGRELEAVLITLGRWGARSPAHSLEHGLGEDSVILAMRTMFSPDAAGDARVRLALRMGDHRYRVRVEEGVLEACYGEEPEAEAVVTTDPGALAAVLWGGRPPADAVAEGAMAVEGDPGALERLAAMLPMPEPAGA